MHTVHGKNQYILITYYDEFIKYFGGFFMITSWNFNETKKNNAI